jgi:hypothetical protein
MMHARAAGATAPLGTITAATGQTARCMEWSGARVAIGGIQPVTGSYKCRSNVSDPPTVPTA